VFLQTRHDVAYSMAATPWHIGRAAEAYPPESGKKKGKIEMNLEQ